MTTIETPIMNTLFTRLQHMGYTDITLNVWHEVRLYVNIKGLPPFAYKLDDRGKVTAKETLERTVFSNICKLTPYVKQHRAEILREFDGAGYVRRKAMVG